MSGKNGLKAGEELGRTAYNKDYARLLHAPSFRRLQNKTQLFPGSESDFFRNRLTHSLEVAQIARGIACSLNSRDVPAVFPGGKIHEDIVEFAAIAHDLGHPPFGHNGEKALNQLMREYGGFEGNAQTLRILTSVERKNIYLPGLEVTDRFGLDLTFRSLASVLKYDREIGYSAESPEELQKGYYSSDARVVAQIKDRVAPGLPEGREFKTIECAIMDMADDIAYSTYDLEDTLHAGFVSPMMLAWNVAENVEVRNEVIKKTNKELSKASYQLVDSMEELLTAISSVFQIPLPSVVRHHLDSIGRQRLTIEEVRDDPRFALMLNAEAWNLDQSLTKDTRARTRFTAERVGRLIAAVKFVPCEDFPQLSRVSMKRQELLEVEVMKHLNYELVIRSPQLAMVENRGKDVVKRIYNALFESKGALLPSEWKNRFLSEAKDEVQQRRVVCDFVACMTDRYAAEMDARLFGEGSSIFRPLGG